MIKNLLGRHAVFSRRQHINSGSEARRIIYIRLEEAGLNIGLYQSWISGFISGANYAQNDVYDISGDTQPTESFEWVKQYCLQFPIDPVPLALHKLIEAWEREGKIIYQGKR